MTDPIGLGQQVTAPDHTTRLRKVADDLEATFLSEMLKSAGVGKSREAFGGGIGEDQFGSFLRDAQAKEMVRAGGIGLSETIFNALKERSE
ncbi:MAG: rod-binding protein [Pseudomonadota bacterium]